jgi:hypothetical protein
VRRWFKPPARPPIRAVGLAICLCLLAATTATAAGSVELNNRVSVSTEVDDNVFNANRGLVADALGRLFYDLSLDWYFTPNNLWRTNYTLGGKLFANERDEDTIINQLQLGYTNFSIPTVQMGLLGSAKLRNIRDAEEDYLKFTGEAFAGKRFIDSIYTGVHALYSEFDFRGTEYYDYWTQNYGADVRYDYERKLSFGVGYDYERKTYPFNALRNIGAKDIVLVEQDEKRADNLHEVRASFRYQTAFFEHYPFFATLIYAFQRNQSNSYGDSYDNHRVTVGVSQNVLPDTSLHLLGTFQFRDSAEKVLIPHSFSIEEDDENYNQMQARAMHGFTDYMSLFVSYQRFWNVYEHDRLSFVKNLYAVGLTFRF